MRRASGSWLLVAFAAAHAVGSPPRNLYEWMALAPLVVTGQVVTDDARFIELQVRSVLRGDAPPGTLVRIDQRRANRGRSPGAEPLTMERGREYLVLLEPRRSGKGPRGGRYDLVRGIEGARQLPAEGAAAWLDAARRLAEVQNLKDDEEAWRSFGEMLADENPLLVDTALDMFLKFRRAATAHLPPLRILLESPRPDVRRRALELVEQVVKRHPREELPDAEGLLVEVISRARRDEERAVRRAAVGALGAFPDDRTDAVLRQIAREDPEQDVRYQAERVLYERSREEIGTRRGKG